MQRPLKTPGRHLESDCLPAGGWNPVLYSGLWHIQGQQPPCIRTNFWFFLCCSGHFVELLELCWKIQLLSSSFPSPWTFSPFQRQTCVSATFVWQLMFKTHLTCDHETQSKAQCGPSETGAAFLWTWSSVDVSILKLFCPLTHWANTVAVWPQGKMLFKLLFSSSN